MIRSNRSPHRPIPPQQPGSLDFRSEEVCARLVRIGAHYETLEQLLAALEQRLPEPPAASPVADSYRPRQPR